MRKTGQFVIFLLASHRVFFEEGWAGGCFFVLLTTPRSRLGDVLSPIGEMLSPVGPVSEVDAVAGPGLFDGGTVLTLSSCGFSFSLAGGHINQRFILGLICVYLRAQNHYAPRELSQLTTSTSLAAT